jgi:hypothetical protein
VILLIATALITALSQLSYEDSDINVNSNVVSVYSSSNYQSAYVEQQVNSEVKSIYDNSLKYSTFTSTFHADVNKVIVTTNMDQTAIINNDSLIVTSASNPVNLGFKTAALELHLNNYFIDNLGYYHLIGEVTNLANTKSTYVQVNAVLYDAAGKQLDETYIKVSEIDPGKTVPIELVSTEKNLRIASVSVNVDSLEYSMISCSNRISASSAIKTISYISQDNASALTIGNCLSSGLNNAISYSIPIQQRQQEQTKFQQQFPSNVTTSASFHMKTGNETTSLSALMLKATIGYDNLVNIPSMGSPVLVSVNISNNNAILQPFVIIMEIRDSNGMTINMQLLNGTLRSNDNIEVSTPWMPEFKGKYEIRSFAVTDLEAPDILSPVVMKSVNVS